MTGSGGMREDGVALSVVQDNAQFDEVAANCVNVDEISDLRR